MKYFIDAFKKYTVFSGRARRKEYWYFYLFSIIVSILVGILSGIIAGVSGIHEITIIFPLVYGLIIFMPSIAVAVRRLHDTNRSGWWFFILLIPFIGAIAFVVFLALDSDEGDNKYGANPKEV